MLVRIVKCSIWAFGYFGPEVSAASTLTFWVIAQKYKLRMFHKLRIPSHMQISEHCPQHFFQNVTRFGQKTWDIIESDYLKPFGSISFVEHHLDAKHLESAVDRLSRCGFNVTGNVAKFTQRSLNGTSGGAMSLVRDGFDAWLPGMDTEGSSIDPDMFRGDD